MNDLTSESEWSILLRAGIYALLILAYFIILKVLLSCIEQLLSKNGRSHKSVIDVQIHQEAANRHADDKDHTFDAFNMALEFLKIVLILGGVVGLFVIIVLKLNVFFAFGIYTLLGVVAWQLVQWRNSNGKEVIKRYEDFIIRIGGYNAGTFVVFSIALILVTVGLIMLP